MTRTSTPCYATPVQPRNTGSLYRLQLSESSRRASSFGGRSAKKDTRPVTDKDFQRSATIKVTEFFKNREPGLLDKGSIKPMTTTMFSNLVGYLVNIYDENLTVSRKNPVDDIQHICQVLCYRGKVDKAWLRTVNTPHSWPHVISFLVWLVDLYLASEAFDSYEAMYPENEDDETDERNFRLLMPHLLKGYNLYNHKQDDISELKEYLIKQKNHLNLDEKEIERLNQEYNKLQEELNNSEDDTEKKRVEDMALALETLRNDIKNTRTYNYKTESYLNQMTEKHEMKLKTLQELEKRVALLEEEKTALHMRVSQQKMSNELKKQIEISKAELNGDIRLLKEDIEVYKDEVYKADIEIVGARSTLCKIIRAYNKEIVTNVAIMPELKIVEIDETRILHNDAIERFEELDENLKKLKENLNSSLKEQEEAIVKFQTLLKKEEAIKLSELELLEELQSERNKLEKEISDEKKMLCETKSRTKKILAEIQESIENKKKELQLEKTEEEYELEEIKKQIVDFQVKYKDHMNNVSTILEDRERHLKESEEQFMEKAREMVAERKQRIEEVLKLRDLPL